MNYKGGYALISMDGIMLETDNISVLSKAKLKEFMDALKSKKRVVLTDLSDENGYIYNACEWVLKFDNDTIYLTNESTIYKLAIDISTRELSCEGSDIMVVKGYISSLESSKISNITGDEPGNVETGDAWVNNKLVITDSALTLTTAQETNLLKQYDAILKKRYVKYGNAYYFLTYAVKGNDNGVTMVFGYKSGLMEQMLILSYDATTKEYMCSAEEI